MKGQSPIDEITAPCKSSDGDGEDDVISVVSSTNGVEGRSTAETRSVVSSTNRSGLDEAADNLYFAKKESQRVVRLRVTVFTLLFLVATGVCVGVYFIIRQGQQEEFEAA